MTTVTVYYKHQQAPWAVLSLSWRVAPLCAQMSISSNVETCVVKKHEKKTIKIIALHDGLWYIVMALADLGSIERGASSCSWWQRGELHGYNSGLFPKLLELAACQKWQTAAETMAWKAQTTRSCLTMLDHILRVWYCLNLFDHVCIAWCAQ